MKFKIYDIYILIKFYTMTETNYILDGIDFSKFINENSSNLSIFNKLHSLKNADERAIYCQDKYNENGIELYNYYVENIIDYDTDLIESGIDPIEPYIIDGIDFTNTNTIHSINGFSTYRDLYYKKNMWTRMYYCQMTIQQCEKSIKYYDEECDKGNFEAGTWAGEEEDTLSICKYYVTNIYKNHPTIDFGYD